MNCAMSDQGFSVTPFTTNAQPGFDILPTGRRTRVRPREAGGGGRRRR
jgi:hypothetical protein